MTSLIRAGDRVRAYYREHSIPTSATGIVIKIERGWITVRMDTETNEDGSNLVRVPSDDVSPEVAS